MARGHIYLEELPRISTHEICFEKLIGLFSGCEWTILLCAELNATHETQLKCFHFDVGMHCAKRSIFTLDLTLILNRV